MDAEGRLPAPRPSSSRFEAMAAASGWSQGEGGSGLCKVGRGGALLLQADGCKVHSAGQTLQHRGGEDLLITWGPDSTWCCCGRDSKAVLLLSCLQNALHVTRRPIGVTGLLTLAYTAACCCLAALWFAAACSQTFQDPVRCKKPSPRCLFFEENILMVEPCLRIASCSIQ